MRGFRVIGSPGYPRDDEWVRFELSGAALVGSPPALPARLHLVQAGGNVAATALTRDLLAAAGDRTVLLITHRTDDLATVDEVITLTDGGTCIRRPQLDRAVAVAS